ncbi:YjfB family protein [Bacillus sp. FJAT-29790]|uniref:YjfB family protein n=1 Tax=Bacillus sp. FJAT-29790 TaxID=1895002 RepID=UPI001C2130FF|nr:YjfB family protein [Bacillus sp. FJAT-29790]
MDISLLSTALSRVQVQQQASISVMKKAMDQGEANVNLLNKMLEEADLQALQHLVQPHLGGNIDLKL